MQAQRPTLSGPLHRVGHVLLVLAGWVIFTGAWWTVLARPEFPVTQPAYLILGTLILLPLITLYWVTHNRSIYARKGPRRQVQVTESPYCKDWAGRVVRADFEQVCRAHVIAIDSDVDEKRFLVLAPTTAAA